MEASTPSRTSLFASVLPSVSAGFSHLKNNCHLITKTLTSSSVEVRRHVMLLGTSFPDVLFRPSNMQCFYFVLLLCVTFSFGSVQYAKFFCFVTLLCDISVKSAV